MKNLSSINYLRKKILKKNINKPFWKLHVEKDIEIFQEGGWHFNNLYDLQTISQKLKVFPHTEFSTKKYSEINTIKKKIENLEDLFERGHIYKKVDIDNSYPGYILKNLNLFKNHIL